MTTPVDDKTLDALLAQAAAPVPQGFAPDLLQRWQRLQAEAALSDEHAALPALEALMRQPAALIHKECSRSTARRLLTWARAAVMAGGGVLALSELMALVFGLWQAGHAF